MSPLSPADAAGAGSPHPGIGFAAFVSLLAALMAMNALATDIMLPALPEMALSLRAASTTETQTVISAYLIGFGLGQIFMGLISDRYGRRLPILIGLGVYLLAALVVAGATDLATALGARFVQGVGAAAPRVIVAASIRDCYSGRRMARVLSLTMMVFMAAPVVAPALGQLTLAFAPWQAIFGLLALYAGGLLVLCWRLYPETLPVERRMPIRRAAVMAGFARVLGDRQTIGYVVAAGAIFGALFGYINSSQQLLVGVYGLGTLFPAVFAATAAALALSSFANARLVERFGMRFLSHAASLCFLGLSVLMLGLDLAGALNLTWLIALLVAVTLLMGLVFPNFNALSMAPHQQAAGIAASVTGAGSTLLGTGLGYIIGQAFNGSATPMAVGFMVCALGTMLTLLITERGRLFRAGQPLGRA
ncbi:MAG: multidrug effflux MFS transporter [Pseudomonadota bacterium]